MGNKNEGKKRKFTCLLMALAMCLTLVPVTVSAAKEMVDNLKDKPLDYK